MNSRIPVAEPTELRFGSGDADCSASYYRPAGAAPYPVIVMAHGLGGVRSMRLPAFAERFAAAGYACLLFDYRYFGESGGEPRQLLDIRSQLEDWKAAIAYARTRPDVNPDEVILWGTSFSGGHVLWTGAEDSRIATVISQCPFTDGLSSSLAMNPLNALKVTALAIRDRIGSWLGASPLMVTTAGKPGEIALMNTHDAYSGFVGISPAGVEIKNYVTARIALDIIRYSPGRRAAEIRCPVLFCVCDPDTVAPAKATLRHASRAANKKIRCYPHGHFEIYVGDAFEQVVSDQLDFLSRTVPVW
jgi:fermentation-respiration switch protein FrsA (DUF1100 family)